MKVGMVTTWGASCGIATYSEELCDALRGVGIDILVLAENAPGSGLTKRSSLPVEYCWTRIGHGNAENVMHWVHAQRLDVLHVQHEFGLFGNNQAFRDLLRQARAAKVATVVTLHTIEPYGGSSVTGFLDMVCEEADAVIAHTAQGVASALCNIGKRNVLSLPHGSWYPRMPGNEAAGAAYLGLDRPAASDKVWCLVFGFIGPNKNIVCTVRAYAEARARRLISDNVGLIICGEIKDPVYANVHLAHAIGASGYERDIVVHASFASTSEIADMMACASFGVLCTLSDLLSASGQVHLYAAHGVPLAVADRPIYADAIRAGAIPYQVNAGALEWPTLSHINAIAALGNSAELRRRVGKRLRNLAESTAWQTLAPRYKRIYEGLVEMRRGKATT